MKRISYLFLVILCSFVLIGCGEESKKSADYWIDQGNKAIEEKDYRTAFVDAEEALKIDPKSISALELRARVFNDKTNRNYAFRDINKVIEMDPKRASAYCYRAKFEFVELDEMDQTYKDEAKGMNDLAKAIEIAPNNAKIYRLRGEAYDFAWKDDLAMQDINKAIELSPKDPDLYYLRSINRNNSNRNDDFAKAIELATDKAKYYAKWSSHINKAIEVATDKDKAKYYARRAEYYKYDKEKGDALADYTKAIELAADADKAKYYQMRASYYAYNSEPPKPDLAIQDLTKVIELAPDNAEAYLIRGNIYSKDKKYDLALKDFDKAVEVALEYEKAEAYGKRAHTYLSLEKKDLAIADINKLFEMDCDSFYTGKAYYLRARYYKLLGDNEKAEQDRKKAKEINPFWG